MPTPDTRVMHTRVAADEEARIREIARRLSRNLSDILRCAADPVILADVVRVSAEIEANNG
jgi:hypothetical protein